MWKIIKKLDRFHLFLGLILVALVTMGAAIPSHITRLDSLVVTDDPSTTTSVTVGENDVYIEGTLEVDGAARFDGAALFGSTVALGSGAVAYTWPTTGGTADYVLRTDGTSTLTWVSAGGATAWTDIGDATGDSTITFANDEVTVLTFADINEPNFKLINTAHLGDAAVLHIETSTGTPTDGRLVYGLATTEKVDGFHYYNSDTELTADTVGLTIDFHDDGDANGIFILCRDHASADTKFSVADDGDTTIAGDLDVTGTATFGTFAINAIAAATSTQTLTLDGDTSGGVNIGSLCDGNVTLNDTVIVSDGFNATIGEGTLTIDNDATNEWGLVITSDATTTAGAIQIVSKLTTAAAAMAVVSITADDVTTGDLLLLDSLAAGMTTGNFINAFDGSGTVFEVGLYGAITMAGNASTNIVTVTAGDIQITNGDIDLDQGQLMVDTTQDLGHNISRNFAGAGGSPCLTINDAHGSGTNAALSIIQGGTVGSEALLITHHGDGAAIEIVAGAARTGNVIDIAMANQLAQNALFIDGAWTGASTVGAIEINTTGNIASGASMIRLDYDTGTPAGTGFAIDIDDDSGDGAGVGYAVLINSAANEGLHVQTGLSAFGEAVTFDAQSVHTLGLDVNEEIDMDIDTNDEFFNITSTAADYAAGSGIITVYDDSAGQTNTMYLLRLATEANADANNAFILCEDNSDGSAASGDDMFAVAYDGSITTAGSATINGTSLIGDGATTQYGFVAVATAMGASAINAEIADSGTIYYNSQAQTCNLPAAAAGLRFTFVVANGSLLTIHPDGADLIIHLGIDAGDKITSTTVGDTITLVAVGAVNWYVESVYPLAADWADGGI